jgi:hypothetical protein
VQGLGVQLDQVSSNFSGRHPHLLLGSSCRALAIAALVHQELAVDRLHIAYLLIILMVVAGAALVGYSVHNQRDSKIERRRGREKSAREKRQVDLEQQG